MREFHQDRSLPLFVTLLVLAFLLMTFDIRSERSGPFGGIRAGANQLLEPVQALASAVVNPVADLVEGLSNITSVREENDALRALLAQREAELAAVSEQLNRLERLETLLQLQDTSTDLVRINANVTGRGDSFDLSFGISKGLEAGVLAGQPVLDENGYLVGRVLDSWRGGATVVPITGDIEAVTVSVGGQDGIVEPIPGSDELSLNREMTLEVFERPAPVEEGDRVITSVLSGSFPPSIPVGEIAADAEPDGQVLIARVQPYFDLRNLEVVVVVVWPPDQAALSADDTAAVDGDETTETTLPETEATNEEPGDGEG
jgi:rod shape-determining protein MreC